MLLWRISNHADLSGQGGLLAKGRWHTQGRAIVYAAEHPALALLEMLVHFDLDEIPASYQLIGIDVPDDSLRTLTADALPKNWLEGARETRAVGDGWLAAADTLLLAVPSAILPHATNFLINPRHPRAGEANIVSVEKVPLDARLK